VIEAIGRGIRAPTCLWWLTQIEDVLAYQV
jgi:hypothetical protein